MKMFLKGRNIGLVIIILIIMDIMLLMVEIYVNRALVILLWLANKSKKFIIKFTGYNDTTIGSILNNIGVTHKDILDRSNKGCKPVNMLDLKGNFLRRFDCC